MPLDENDFFSTSDLPLAATLYSFGAVIDAVDRNDPSRSVFCFKREKGLDGLVQGYWAGGLQVEPQAYFNALKAVKNRLYDHR